MHLDFRNTNPSVENEIRAFLALWSQQSSFDVNTSGSTGEPKKINIQKEYALASAKKTLDFFHLKKGDTALLCLSPNTIAGKMMLVRAILGELKLIIVDVNSNPLTSIKEGEKIDFAAMVPLQVQNVLDNTPQKLKNIKNLIIGGAPSGRKLQDSIASLGVNAFQTFGMTETISHVALKKITQEDEPFVALSNTSFSSGKEGNLIINAPDIGINNLETNDIVELLDKRSFKWMGRKDRVINTGGIKLFPENIEAKIDTDQPFFISSIPDELLGNKLILCIEGSSFNTDLLKMLDKYEKPKEIYFWNRFSYTASDKIDRINTMKKLKDARKQVL